jgi:hypothetical protein
MIRQLEEFNVARLHVAGGMEFAAAAHQPRPKPLRPVDNGGGRAKRFPRRPDTTVISEAIPLYYIARNKNALWLAREAGGRTGGLFFFKRSAIGFSNRKSAHASCATMFLADPFELDVPNEGGRLAALFDSTMDAMARRMPAVVAFARSTITKWRRLITEVARIRASERSHREAIERELFRGQYILSSKNDDDLPIP